MLTIPGEKVRLFWYWFGVFSVLVITPNLGYVLGVLFSVKDIGIVERLGLVSTIYSNSLLFVFQPIPLSVFILSLILAVNFSVIQFVRRNRVQMGGRLRSTLTVFVSGHCVACGGSLLAPFFSLLTGTSSYFSSERYLKIQLLTVILNLVAMAIAIWSMKRSAGALHAALENVVDNTPGGY